MLSRLGFLAVAALTAVIWTAAASRAQMSPQIAQNQIAQNQMAQNKAPAFLSAIDDVPLMPGLTERQDHTVVFDKPEGRIVESVAEGRLSRAQVQKFYAATLPQLGWKLRGEDRFLREGEELVLSFKPGASGGLAVHFALSPSH